MALNWVQPDPGQAGRSPLALPGRPLTQSDYVGDELESYKITCPRC